MTTDVLIVYMTCSKHIQSKTNKGVFIWNQGRTFGLHKWKLSCIFAFFVLFVFRQSAPPEYKH